MPTKERAISKLPKLSWEMFEEEIRTGGMRATALGKAIQLAGRRYYIHSIGWNDSKARGWDDSISDAEMPATITLKLSPSKDIQYGLGAEYTLYRDGRVTINEQRTVEVALQDPIEEAGHKIVSLQVRRAKKKAS